MSLILICLLSFAAPVFANTNEQNEPKAVAVFKVGAGKYVVNDLIKEDAAPYIKNGRTYLPIRYVAYALGIGDNSIAWDDDSETVYLVKNGEIMKVKVGGGISLGNRQVSTDAPPEISQGRAMLPLRAVAEAFGCKVNWDNDTQKVFLYVNP